MLRTRETIAALLRAAGLDDERFVVEPGAQGGNNRVDLVRCANRVYVAKWYFHSVEDRRDRLSSEWQFLTFAQDAGIDAVPAPLARLHEERVALYEFIEGDRLSTHEIGEEEVREAATFLAEINTPERRLKAAGLPTASEAFWTVADHVAHVDQRLDRFSCVDGKTPLDHEASALIWEIRECWRSVKSLIQDRLTSRGEALEHEVPPGNRCVSPSDFGFHNALVTRQGRLAFIDFEYAGWDDPAKTLSDFFFQPAVRVPERYFELFAQLALRHVEDRDSAIARTHLLRPLFGLKWCCIILNPFMPNWAARRRFANRPGDLETLKRTRLSDAKDALAHLKGIAAMPVS
jgi:hypothetical protein